MTATSFGHYPRVQPYAISPIYSRHDRIDFSGARPFLAYAHGRSYGDSCLNADGILLHTKRLNHWLAFDPLQGIIRCEAGVTFKEILDLIVPHGWFLPVVPGTQLLSLGGAIANDIHGKNHHQVGTFGRFVKCFELLRSTGERLLCSPTEQHELFAATIGGLGLTGLITWAEIALMPIQSPYLMVETIPFGSLAEYLEHAQASHVDYPYTVAWLDAMSQGRGIFIRAQHLALERELPIKCRQGISIPRYFPGGLLNAASLKLFNHMYYHRHSRHFKAQIVHYQDYFFPLDGILHWNRLYGKLGFIQYQCVIPGTDMAIIQCLLRTIQAHAAHAYLSVLKSFGSLPSPGILSFPMAGMTVTFDFSLREPQIMQLCQTLDDIVCAHQGRIYPAKDARMSGDVFKLGYPAWQTWLRHKDQRFSSSFWRRMMEGA
jgi:FAD/FMN-containing dehydrogenase